MRLADRRSQTRRDITCGNPVTPAEKSSKSEGFSTPDPPVSHERADTRGRFTAIGLSVAPVQQMLFPFRHGVGDLRGHGVRKASAP